jgi:hypothetical protein
MFQIPRWMTVECHVQDDNTFTTISGVPYNYDTPHVGKVLRKCSITAVPHDPGQANTDTYFQRCYQRLELLEGDVPNRMK